MMSEENKRNEDGVELLKMVLITNTLHTYTTILFDVTFIAIATAARVLEHSAATEKFSRRKLRQPFSDEMSSNDTRNDLTSQTSQQSEDGSPMSGSEEEMSTKRSKRIRKRIQKSFAYVRNKAKALTSVNLLSHDEAETNTEEAPAPVQSILGLHGLMDRTKFTKEELQIMYRGFKTECPSGLMTKETFVSIYNMMFPKGDSSLYAQRLFNSFDKNKTGMFTFEDFVLGLSVSLHGTPEQKLKWAFELYDIDGDGNISKEELRSIVMSIYPLRYSEQDYETSTNLIHRHIDIIFETMDVNGDGTITEDEFINSCLADPDILANLTIQYQSLDADQESLTGKDTAEELSISSTDLA